MVWKATLPKLKDWQKDVYFLAGANKEEIARRLFLESFFEKEGDILYRTDPIDVHMFQQIRDFKIDGEDDDLVKMKGANVLRFHPANVSSSEFGHSASMERVICA